MVEVGRAFPGYGFSEHKGYSTSGHFAAIREHGPCIHHRRSFAPIRIALGLDPQQIDLFAEPEPADGIGAAA
jgi:ribonuclease HII